MSSYKRVSLCGWLHARRTRKHRRRKVSRKRRGNYEKYDPIHVLLVVLLVLKTCNVQNAQIKTKKQSNTCSTPMYREANHAKKTTRKLGGSDVRKHALAETTFASAQGLRKRSVTSMRTNNKGKKKQHPSAYCERSESIGVLRL